MRRNFVLGLALWPILLPVVLWPAGPEDAKSKLDSTQRFLFLQTLRVSTMRKELNEAAAAGYRVRTGGCSSGGGMDFTLEKVAQPPEVFEYKIVDTTQGGGILLPTWDKVEKTLNEAGAQGFRLIPLTLGEYWGLYTCMEKAPGSKSRYEYKIVCTARLGCDRDRRGGNFMNRLYEARGEGYHVIGMVDGFEHNAVFLERQLDAPGASPSSAVEGSKADAKGGFMVTASGGDSSSSSVQKHLNQYAGEGHRVLAASAHTEVWIIWEKVAAPSEPYQYLWLVPGKNLQKELNQAAAQGFRLLPMTLVAYESSEDDYEWETAMIMEKPPGSEKRFQYLVPTHHHGSKLAKELAQAVEDGYELVAGLILEKTL